MAAHLNREVVGTHAEPEYPVQSAIADGGHPNKSLTICPQAARTTDGMCRARHQQRGLFWDQGAKTAGVPVAHVQKPVVAQRSQFQLDPHSQWEHAPHAAEGTLCCPTVTASPSSQGEGVTKDMVSDAGAASSS